MTQRAIDIDGSETRTIRYPERLGFGRVTTGGLRGHHIAHIAAHCPSDGPVSA